MRLWVTGASGFLGRELVRLAPGADATRVEVTDAAAVAEHVRATSPQAIIHTAYRQEGERARAITVDGAANVARAAARAGARLVHLSTDVVFSGRKGVPYVEDDVPDPVTEYGRAKADAELLVAEAAPGALLVRTSLVYGGPGHEPSKHELAARDPDAVFFEDELRCPVQVTDLARALLALAAGDEAGPLHLVGADGVSRADFAELVAGRSVRRAPAPPARPLDCRLASSRVAPLRGVREVLG